MKIHILIAIATLGVGYILGCVSDGALAQVSMSATHTLRDADIEAVKFDAGAPLPVDIEVCYEWVFDETVAGITHEQRLPIKDGEWKVVFADGSKGVIPDAVIKNKYVAK